MDGKRYEHDNHVDAGGDGDEHNNNNNLNFVVAAVVLLEWRIYCFVLCCFCILKCLF